MLLHIKGYETSILNLKKIKIILTIVSYESSVAKSETWHWD
jgi:hypothetical protein